ncbi:MAG: carboxypeptidase regulatory-like domain-containing protein [Polyangiaceae bacterium]|nr:carboxypeptidase regulatory-like domain-containing protein [Polyangiaceae bacterium]
MFRSIRFASRTVPLLLLACGFGCGCRKQDPVQTRKAIVRATPVGVPVDAGVVIDAVNPAGVAPYAGPVAMVFGTVTMKGDPPPRLDRVLAKIPTQCEGAASVYGSLFREGKGRAVADAMVAVTGYKGYVPAREPSHRVKVDHCAWESRTVALSFGQRIEIINESTRTYVPKLLGSPQQAMLVSVPHGDPVAVYPLHPGRYVLADAGFPFMQADVFVVKYSTHDVTDLGGHYSIGGVPPGEVTVTAFLPAIGAQASTKVKLLPNASRRVDLTLKFDASALKAAEPSDAGTAEAAKAAELVPE